MKRGLFSLLFVLVQFSIFGQENFMAGYIISPEGDTIRGKVDFRDWANNPEKVSFAANPSNEIIPLSPEDILGFGVEGAHYVSATTDVGTDSRKTANLDNRASLNKTVKSIFLQSLIQGDKSLYYYNEIGDKEHFYIRDKSKFQLLEFKEYYSYDRFGKKLIKENNKYLGQLRLYLTDCESIQSHLQKVKYTKSSLRNLFEKYYSCIPQEGTFDKQKEGFEIKWGIIAGGVSSNLIFKSGLQSNASLVKADIKPSHNVMLGISLEAVILKNQKKWSIYNELLYSANTFADGWENYRNETGYSKTEIDLGLSYLKLNNMIRYKYPVSGIKLFGNIGISNALAFNVTNKKITEIQFEEDYHLREGKVLDETRNYEQGLLVGFGMELNSNLTVEFRHERSNGMSPYPALTSSVRRNALLVHFQF